MGGSNLLWGGLSPRSPPLATGLAEEQRVVVAAGLFLEWWKLLQTYSTILVVSNKIGRQINQGSFIHVAGIWPTQNVAMLIIVWLHFESNWNLLIRYIHFKYLWSVDQISALDSNACVKDRSNSAQNLKYLYVTEYVGTWMCMRGR